MSHDCINWKHTWWRGGRKRRREEREKKNINLVAQDVLHVMSVYDGWRAGMWKSLEKGNLCKSDVCLWVSMKLWNHLRSPKAKYTITACLTPTCLLTEDTGVHSGGDAETSGERENPSRWLVQQLLFSVDSAWRSEICLSPGQISAIVLVAYGKVKASLVQ